MRSGQTAADGPLSDLAPTAPRRQAPFWASVAPPPVCRCSSSQRAPGYPPEQTPGPPSAPNRLRSLPGPRPQPAHPCETGSPDHPSPEGRSRPNPPDRQHRRPSLRIPGSPVPLLCGVARSRRAGQINWARLAFLHLVVAVVYQIGGTTVTKSSVQPGAVAQPGTNIRTDRAGAARQAAAASKRDHAVMAAAMPGMMRRMRAPARTADRERGQCPGCEVGAAQAGYLRGQRAALAELEHRLVVPENMTLTRVAPGGHGPGGKREPGTLFALCDYLMLFDLF